MIVPMRLDPRETARSSRSVPRGSQLLLVLLAVLPGSRLYRGADYRPPVDTLQPFHVRPRSRRQRRLRTSSATGGMPSMIPS